MCFQAGANVPASCFDINYWAVSSEQPSVPFQNCLYRWMIPADTQKPAETALQQINEKKYDAELTAAGVKTIYKYGVAFSGKKVEVAVG